MKNKINKSIAEALPKMLIVSILLMTSQAMIAQCQEKSIWYTDSYNRTYFDLGTYIAPVKGYSLKDFDISDSKEYGLMGLDSNSKESRFRVPLSSAPQFITLNGIMFGVRTMRGPARINTASHFKYAWVSTEDFRIHTNQFSLEVSPVLYTKNKFRILGNFELGSIGNTIIINHLHPLSGYHDYYNQKKIIIKNDDKLKIKTLDLNTQIGLTFQYALSKNTFFFATTSFNGYLTANTISTITSGSSKGEELSMDSAGIYTTNLSKSLHYYGQPQYKLRGFTLALGFSFYMYDNKDYMENKAKADIVQPTATDTPPAEKVNRCKCCGKIIPADTKTK